MSHFLPNAELTTAYQDEVVGAAEELGDVHRLVGGVAKVTFEIVPTPVGESPPMFWA